MLNIILTSAFTSAVMSGIIQYLVFQLNKSKDQERKIIGNANEFTNDNRRDKLRHTAFALYKMLVKN